MKQFVKVLIWIIVLGAIFAGVYSILPEYPQSVIKGVFQPMVDAQAKKRISDIQNLVNEDVGANYKAILEKNTGIPGWVYEASADGTEYVRFYGSGAPMNLKDWTEYDGKLSTGAMIKVEFKIVGNKVDIFPYIDGKLMYIPDDGVDNVKYKESNKEIKKDIFQQLYSGSLEG